MKYIFLLTAEQCELWFLNNANHYLIIYEPYDS